MKGFTKQGLESNCEEREQNKKMNTMPFPKPELPSTHT